MAVKSRAVYVCNACGSRQPKWAGQCADCGAWNSLAEVAEARRPVLRGGYTGTSATRIETLAEVSPEERARIHSGIGELDRVLGGGLVAGSVVLLGGDPGIGKSTLLLQACAALATTLPVLYVSGEESPQQIGLRARRLGLTGGLAGDGIRLLAETCVERILEHAAAERPQIMVVDSIQTLFTEVLQSAPGSVSQVRECGGAAGALCQNNRIRWYFWSGTSPRMARWPGRECWSTWSIPCCISRASTAAVSGSCAR